MDTAIAALKSAAHDLACRAAEAWREAEADGDWLHITVGFKKEERKMAMRVMTRIRRTVILLAGAAFLGSLLTACSYAPATPTAAPASLRPVVVSGAGDITAAVERYRALLGPDNGGGPGSKPTGRREINWDKVPDELAAPNFLPADFFNAPTAPRARGAHLSTPGRGVQVSARRDNPAGIPVRFGHINPTYPNIFKTFSEERLFSPIGSNVVDLTFYVPGSGTPALTRGFGAVYTDVDTEHTAFEYFDKDGRSLGSFAVPIADKALSFLGVVFDKPVVARVRIEYGTVALGPDDSPTNDVAVMDDFIYGEPQAAAPARVSPGSSGY